MTFGTFMLIVAASGWVTFIITGFRYHLLTKRVISKTVGRKLKWDSLTEDVRWYDKVLYWSFITLIDFVFGYGLLGLSSMIVGDGFEKSLVASTIVQLNRKNDFSTEELEKLNDLVKNYE